MYSFIGTIVQLYRNNCPSKVGLYKFKKATLFSARATYSLPSILGQRIITSITSNPVMTNQLQSEINQQKIVLAHRTTYLIGLLSKLGYAHYSYHDGFFITIKTNEPEKVLNELKNSKIYAIKVDTGVRLAISSVAL